MNNYVTESVCTRQEKRRALRLLSHHRGSTDRLVAQREILQAGARSDRFFWRALLESFALNYLNCGAFQNLCNNKGLHPCALPSAYNLSTLPYVGLPAGSVSGQAKEAEKSGVEIWQACSSSAIKVRYPANSTPESPLEVQLDARSLRRLKRSWLNVGHALGLTTREKINYLSLRSAPPTPATDGWDWISLLTRTNKSSATLDSADNILKDFVEEGSALRLVGDLNTMLRWTATTTNNLSSLPVRSLVWVYDDWHKHPEYVNQRERLAAAFQIDVAQVRFVCRIPYFGIFLATCTAGHLHLPQTVRALVRDPQTLCPVPAGYGGKLQIVSPMVSSQATPSVLFSQKVIITSGCSCGVKAPYIDFVDIE